MNSLRIAHEHHVYSDHVEATPEYWDSIANEWQQQGDERSWRVVSDAVNLELLRRWLPMEHGGRVLKTDLFDEGVGTGLVPQLTARFDHVAGIDISPSLVAMVRARFPQLEAEIADVRALPFADASFDAVVSNSTLDHFTSRDDIEASFRELNRVMRVGGTFLVTLDNPLNPVVAIRNGLSDRLRAATHLVPFAVGATCGPRQLRTLLRASGFEVARMSAVFHCPRVLAVLGGHAIDRFGSHETKRRYARLWTAFEGLASLPTRYLTGYFVAALARKP